jgi:hypothetical protein
MISVSCVLTRGCCSVRGELVNRLTSKEQKRKGKAEVHDIKITIVRVAAHVTAKQSYDARRCSRAKARISVNTGYYCSGGGGGRRGS